jgi:hypothetical protein
MRFVLSGKPALSKSQQENDEIGEAHREPARERQGAPGGRGCAAASEMGAPETHEIEEGRGKDRADQEDASSRGEPQAQNDQGKEGSGHRVRWHVDMGILDEKLPIDMVDGRVQRLEIDRRLLSVVVRLGTYGRRHPTRSECCKLPNLPGAEDIRNAQQKQEQGGSESSLDSAVR